MGDNRASIKIEFSIYGEEFKTDMSINYSPVEGCTDRRVCEFFEVSYAEARGKWEAKLYDDMKAQRDAAQEREERAELDRLKKKYEQGGP